MHKHKLLKWKYTNLRNDESKYLRTFLLTEYWNMKDKVENTDNNMLYLKILKTVEILLKKVSVILYHFANFMLKQFCMKMCCSLSLSYYRPG